MLDFLIDHKIYPFLELGLKPLIINKGVEHIVNRYGVNLKRVSPKIKVGGPGIVLGSENHRFRNVFGIWKLVSSFPKFFEG